MTGKENNTIPFSGELNTACNSCISVQIVEGLNAGICVVDYSQVVHNCNHRFLEICHKNILSDIGFYKALGECEIVMGDFCPFHTVRRTKGSSSARIKLSEDRYYEMEVSPVMGGVAGEYSHFVVELRDVTLLCRLDKTIKKLQSVGAALTDLSQEELREMSHSARIELLKSRIETKMTEIFPYTHVEFRLYNPQSKELEPFLAYGMPLDVVQRRIYAKAEHNGIVGYVAHSKDVYHCMDTVDDPLYLPGVSKAQSAIVFPLLYHDVLLGTCAIESEKPVAFSDRDILFLRAFINDVAMAIHTFDLLSHENEKAVLDSIHAVHGSVAPLIDTILQQASVLYRDDDPVISGIKIAGSDKEHLFKILEAARGIKTAISNVKTKMASMGNEEGMVAERPLLRGRRILVIDPAPSVCASARDILERYGAIVETTNDTLTAINMIKTSSYDVIICYIFPKYLFPDSAMDGHQLFLRLKELWPSQSTIPLLLTVDIGVHDKDHIVVETRRNGLAEQAFARPFHLAHVLCNFIERIIRKCAKQDADGNILPPTEYLDAPISDSKTTRTRGTPETTLSRDNYYHQYATFSFLDGMSDQDVPPTNLIGDTPVLDAT